MLKITHVEDGKPPCEDEIRAQLHRIITSTEFPNVGRGAAFLTFIVEEALAGRSSRIKGYTIALEVFKRDEKFTQEDNVVRIQAGRLRRVLERYYLTAGQADPIRIDIPKGGYAPVFTWSAPALVERSMTARLLQTGRNARFLLTSLDGSQNGGSSRALPPPPSSWLARPTGFRHVPLSLRLTAREPSGRMSPLLSSRRSPTSVTDRTQNSTPWVSLKSC